MTYVLWIVQAFLALVFLSAGSMKLVLPLEVLTAQTGLPGLFIRVVGVAEVLGGLGLILPGLLRIRPNLTPLAAAELVHVMLGATLVTWDDQHLRMDAVHHLTPPRVRRWLNLITTLAFVGAGVFVLAQSLRVLLLAARTGQRSVVADLPMVIPFAAIPLSFAIIVGMLVRRFRRFVGSREEER